MSEPPREEPPGDDWRPPEWTPPEWEPRDWHPPAAGEPEETLPFTHRPYGADEAEETTSPTSPTSTEGPSAQGSGPAHVAPSGGTPTPGPPPPHGLTPAPLWGAGPAPVPIEHKGATTSMVLGIVAIVSLVATPFCCITLAALITAPIAMTTGRKALKQIDQAPAYYRNRGQAAFGFWSGLVCTVIGAIVFVLIVLFFVWVGTSDSAFDGLTQSSQPTSTGSLTSSMP